MAEMDIFARAVIPLPLNAEVHPVWEPVSEMVADLFRQCLVPHREAIVPEAIEHRPVNADEAEPGSFNLNKAAFVRLAVAVQKLHRCSRGPVPFAFPCSVSPGANRDLVGHQKAEIGNRP